MKRKRENPTRKKTQSKEPSEADREQRDDARKTQQMLEQSLVEIKKRIDQPETSESNRRQLTELAAELERAMGQADPQDSDRAQWDRVVKSDEAKRLLAAIANGEPMADTPWNKLLSTLDDALVASPEEAATEAYRKPSSSLEIRLRELTGVFDKSFVDH